MVMKCPRCEFTHTALIQVNGFPAIKCDDCKEVQRLYPFTAQEAGWLKTAAIVGPGRGDYEIGRAHV